MNFMKHSNEWKEREAMHLSTSNLQLTDETQQKSI